ncbi:MAG: hypothetical protein JW749_07780 [Sedimentisphaerales bacterium]|nr:hypothetical protein [Sedimentisphaerales bacterium]
MKNPQNFLLAVLILTNVFAGFGLAIPLGDMLAKITGQQKKLKRFVTLVIGAYFLECLAFTVGMCTQIFTFGLAIIWGIILGLWWRGRTQSLKPVKTTVLFSLYGCVPTLSLTLWLPVMWLLAGQGILNVEQAAEFGIPQFVPWPFNTMLGFCAGLAIGTILIKTLITTGLVKWLVSGSAQITGLDTMGKGL